MDWNKTFEILRRIRLKFREKRVIYNLYSDQTAVIKVDDKRQALTKKNQYDKKAVTITLQGVHRGSSKWTKSAGSNHMNLGVKKVFFF